jgi:hypothetical protein
MNLRQDERSPRSLLYRILQHRYDETKPNHCLRDFCGRGRLFAFGSRFTLTKKLGIANADPSLQHKGAALMLSCQELLASKKQRFQLRPPSGKRLCLNGRGYTKTERLLAYVVAAGRSI